MKLLYLANNTIEANIIKNQLSELNINAFLSGSNLEAGVGELPVDVMFTKVFVSKSDFDNANSFIEEYNRYNLNCIHRACTEMSMYDTVTTLISVQN